MINFNPWINFRSGFNDLWFDYFGFMIFILIIWFLVFWGLALWKAAKQNSKSWFMILLVLNKLGILEILYLYVFSKKFLFRDNQDILQ